MPTLETRAVCCHGQGLSWTLRSWRGPASSTWNTSACSRRVATPPSCRRWSTSAAWCTWTCGAHMGMRARSFFHDAHFPHGDRLPFQSTPAWRHLCEPSVPEHEVNMRACTQALSDGRASTQEHSCMHGAPYRARRWEAAAAQVDTAPRGPNPSHPVCMNWQAHPGEPPRPDRAGAQAPPGGAAWRPGAGDLQCCRAALLPPERLRVLLRGAAWCAAQLGPVVHPKGCMSILWAQLCCCMTPEGCRRPKPAKRRAWLIWHVSRMRKLTAVAAQDGTGGICT